MLFFLEPIPPFVDFDFTNKPLRWPSIVTWDKLYQGSMH
jgi:hypothetical protein